MAQAHGEFTSEQKAWSGYAFEQVCFALAEN